LGWRGGQVQVVYLIWGRRINHRLDGGWIGLVSTQLKVTALVG